MSGKCFAFVPKPDKKFAPFHYVDRNSKWQGPQESLVLKIMRKIYKFFGWVSFKIFLFKSETCPTNENEC